VGSLGKKHEQARPGEAPAGRFTKPADIQTDLAGLAGRVMLKAALGNPFPNVSHRWKETYSSPSNLGRADEDSDAGQLDGHGRNGIIRAEVSQIRSGGGALSGVSNSGNRGDFSLHFI
jgi:hypothetical protein